MTGHSSKRRDPPLRVLVADDSSVVRHVVTEILKDAGYQTESVPDGAAALRAMEKTTFDVIVTDLHMPPPDGFGLLEVVRARDPLLPVIILTGSHAHDVDAAVRALRLGAQDYLTKPLAGREQIVLAIERALGQRREREALREAHKMEAIGRMAGGIAHDFNNALGIIMGTVSLMRRDPLVQGRIADDLGRIAGAAERAARLTHQLLAFSRRQILQPRTVDLNDIVRGMQDLLQSMTGEAVQLSTELVATPACVRVDRGQIEQVITNLVLNACDALPAGGRVTIETSDWEVAAAESDSERSPLPAGRYVRLVVADNGSGMEPAVKARLFEPFFTTKGMDRASGLGLAVVHGIVTQHGGHVRVVSEAGQGSSFGIYLPRVAAGSPAVAKPPVVKVAPAAGAPTATALVVEDDEDLRALLRRGLRVQGYSVLDAPDGPAALALVKQHSGTLDVLVTDVVMPGGMNGVEVAHAVRHLRPGIRIILMTGHPQSAIPSGDTVPAGMVVLAKPFTLETLAQKMLELRGSDACVAVSPAR